MIAIVVETTQRVVTERLLKDRENELARVQQIARDLRGSVDLRNGFDSGRRSPEYLEIHGLSPDAVDTHEDWVRRIHPDGSRADRACHFRRTSMALMRVFGGVPRSSGRTMDKSGGSPARRRSSGTKRASRCADRRPYRHYRADAGQGAAEGERRALPADRQQRAGADVGQQAGSHARLRQSGLSGFSRPADIRRRLFSTGARFFTQTI